MADHLSFVSLVPVGGLAPLVSYPQALGNPPYGPHCHRFESTFSVGGLFVYGLDLAPGKSSTYGIEAMKCPANFGRPAGRYRLYMHIDPSETLDTPGYAGNNVGRSGTLEWVNLRN